jgi:hypothetical protein
MDIKLDERHVANAAKAMDLSALDDENVTGARFEFLSVDRPEASAFSDELDLIVRMTMGPRTTSRQGTEKEDRNIDVAVLGSNELVRATLKGQVLLTDTIHHTDAPLEVDTATRR